MHGSSRMGGFTEIGYNRSGIHKGEALSPETKGILCRLINDKALKRLCQKRSLMVDLLTEQTYIKSTRCLGLNENAKNIYVVLRSLTGKILPYTDVVAIILHELVHHTHHDHGDDFKRLEQIYRKDYIRYARQTGTIPSWEKIEFPNSTGPTIAIKGFGSPVNRSTTTVLLTAALFIMASYRVIRWVYEW